MRFLSKFALYIIICGVALCVSPFVCLPRYVQANSIEQQDDTIFNLNYGGKVWVFNSSEFEINSNIFTINARVNAFNRNGGRQHKIELLNSLIDINISPEVAFNYIYLGFNEKIEKISKNIEKTSKNAKIIIKNNKINILNEVIGVKLNKFKLYNDLIEQYKKDKIINLTIPVIKSLPEITSDMLRENTYKRSEFTTDISSSSVNRKNNIRRAIKSISGTKLGKKEKFSFNQCVGKRTEQNGYTQAKIIVDGEFVEGVGGGVCQVSSTMYNAVLLAGLDVLQAQKHSQRVSYVKAGFDAMVNYGSSDLVFENNTQGDIYIIAKFNQSNITVEVYGISLNGVVYERENEIVDEIEPPAQQIKYDTESKYIDKVKYDDECFELKVAKKGYTVKSYRLKYINGELIEKTLLRIDKYPPQASVIVYGTQKRESEITRLDEMVSIQDIE